MLCEPVVINCLGSQQQNAAVLYKKRRAFRRRVLSIWTAHQVGVRYLDQFVCVCIMDANDGVGINTSRQRRVDKFA